MKQQHIVKFCLVVSSHLDFFSAVLLLSELFCIFHQNSPLLAEHLFIDFVFIRATPQYVKTILVCEPVLWGPCNTSQVDFTNKYGGLFLYYHAR